MKPLKIGITGVRGIVGETFTPELAVDFAESFGTYLDRGRILVCRDTRPSGPMIRSAVLAGLFFQNWPALSAAPRLPVFLPSIFTFVTHCFRITLIISIFGLIALHFW